MDSELAVIPGFVNVKIMWIMLNKKLFYRVLAFYIKDEERGFPSINSYFW